MIRAIVEMFIGCTHQRTTFPQSPRRTGKLNRFQRRQASVMCCLDCGAEFEYDWRAMKVGKRVYPKPHTPMREIAPTLDAEA